MTALVATWLCPLYLQPDTQSELADEALLGWELEILEETAPGWVQVRTDYGYTGYAPAENLLTGEDSIRRWREQEKRTVLKGICSVRSETRVQGWRVGRLLRGAVVAVHGAADENGWQLVSLPDGRRGYTKEGFLFEVEKPQEEQALRQRLCAMAQLYRDAHYEWGGKTMLGIDCSGLTFMAYRLSGVTIWRDASLREGYPLHAIDPARVQPGDLLFFPGHVAMYLGEGRYIHSTARTGSDGVVINSLDPAHGDYRADLAGQITGAGTLF